MQRLDPLRQLVRDGRCGLERHSPTRLGACAAAVEAQPALGIDELAVSIDEIGDPQHAVTQIDRRFAALATAQDLALDRHGTAWFAMLMADIFGRPTGKVAKKLLKMPPQTLGERGALGRPLAAYGSQV